MDKTTNDNMVKDALKARNNAYAPYSHFKVGAAVLGEDNKVYTGCNVENASYGGTVCAERIAIFNAVSKGITKIKKIAIASDSDKITMPCGICRQVAYEFGGDDLVCLCADNKGEYKEYKLKQLLPEAFK